VSAREQAEDSPRTVARITAATGAELDKLLKDIYDQKFAGTIIPEQIEQLNRAKLATALGRLQDQYDPITLQWYNRQMRAVYSFSAAKSYTEAQELKALVFDADGNIRPYTQFRADALALYNNYNENWLETEFNTVKRGNQMGRKWLQIQKDKEAYPFLQYIAELDDRVREAHKELHGFIAEVDDAIWNDIYPPNGWNCRCTVKQLSRKQAEELKSLWLRNYDGDRSVNKSLYGPIDEFATNMPENFKRNTGKEAVIETESSVYYKKYSGSTKKFQLRPEKDYNMKSIEQIYQKANLLPALLPSPVQTAQQIDAWFAQNTVNNQISYRWNGITPIDVFFTKDTLKHMKMPKQLAEKRFLLFGSIDDVIKNPDEIWLNESAQVKGFVFIKYYQDKPVVVIVSEKNAIQTLYQLDNPQKNERLGKLIYRK
ncbi:MAG TPA: hypothetical protein DCM08_12620, partial [Microscillaceae bacterium]|nr:hypothetical protein [Microscillaceae bacterium]